MYLDHSVPQVGLTGREAFNLTASPHVEETATMIENNHNLSKQAKELLLWHCRLGHTGFKRIRGLIRDLVLHTLIVDVDKCEDVICPACQLSRHHRKTPNSQRTAID